MRVCGVVLKKKDYIALRSTWLRDRDGFLLVFSLTDRMSFDALHPFHEQLEVKGRRRKKGEKDEKEGGRKE